MKIPLSEWAKKHDITKEASINLLHRRILQDPVLSKKVEKVKVMMEQWYIEEDLRAIKTASGKWELV